MKKSRYLLILVLLASMIVTAMAANEVTLTVPGFDIYINGAKVVNNGIYPIAFYDGIVYVPLTKKNVELLGIKAFSDEKDIKIETVSEGSQYISGEGKDTKDFNLIASYINKDCYINNSKVDFSSDRFTPLIYENVIYIPLSNNFAVKALKWKVSYVDNKGLFIYTGTSNESSVVPSLDKEEPIADNKRVIISNALNLSDEITSKLKGKKPYYIFDSAVYYKEDLGDKKAVGIYKWRTGESYVGEFKNDKFSGLGVMTWPTGEKYVGEFKNGDFNGIGRYFYTDDSRSKIGIFKDGNMIEDNIKYTDRKPEYSQNQNVLVILTEFRDTKLKTTMDDWKEYFFSPTHSVGKYYKDVSNGLLTLLPAEESYDENDGIVKVLLDYNHPNYGDKIEKQYTITRDSIAKADEFIDFEKYDTNYNGYIDSNELIIVNVVSGYEYDKSITIKSVKGHRGYISEGNTIFDDIDVDSYALIGEMHYDSYHKGNPYMATIAVGAHEMGHLIGLPDLYDTDLSSSGIGHFGLMGYGVSEYSKGEKPGDSPLELSPWSRIKLGFTVPKVVGSSGIYEVYSKGSGKYNILKVPINDNEYFLIENRDFTRYDKPLDKYTGSGGIMIWHIDNDVINKKMFDNLVNDDEKHKGIDIEEADEGRLGYSQLDRSDTSYNYDPFFRSVGVKLFNDRTKPSAMSYDKKPSGISIEVLKDGDTATVKIDID